MDPITEDRIREIYREEIERALPGIIAYSGMLIISKDLQLQKGRRLGFFGKTPAAQQSTPVTLAQVIALLQSYGLCP